MSLYQILRNLIKSVYINKYRSIHVAKSARIGNYSRLIVTEERKDTSEYAAITLHEGVGIGRFSELQVWDGNQIIIKDDSSLNDNCKILGDVVIEKYCTMSANIFASSGNHYATVKPSWLIREQDKLVLSTEAGRKAHSKKIQIEEDCWVGYGVFIKQGVYIGRGAIIGAYTFVSKDVPPYSIQVGTPNKEIKRRLDYAPPSTLTFSQESHLPYFYRGFCHHRDQLEKGRKKDVIIAERESIITLAGKQEPKELEISGLNMLYPKWLTLTISLNGTNFWKIKVSDEKIDLKLSVLDTLKGQIDHLYSSLGNDIKKHSVICIIAASESGASKYPLGINLIKLK